VPANDTISILDGSTFVVSDAHGDVEAGPDQIHGLIYRDTRFLSRWAMKSRGRLMPASRDGLEVTGFCNQRPGLRFRSPQIR
jgi:hypothetical protein